jgi:hypothetical protein
MKIVYKRRRQAIAQTENLKSLTVKTVEAILCSHPDESETILRECPRGKIPKTLVRPVGFEGKPPRGKVGPCKANPRCRQRHHRGQHQGLD